MKKPNVILVCTDDQGYGDLGIYGNTDIYTPNLDRLARGGVLLTQHYSASPMCAPARAALLTGRYNHRTGAVDVPSNRGLDRISLRETTIADCFRAAGYSTGMVGKWHNGVFDVHYHPNSRGFNEFAGFLNGGMRYYRWIIDYNGTPRRSNGRYLTDVFTDEAVQFIQRNAKKRFFLYLAYNAPHSPYEAPKEDVSVYQKLGKFNGTVCTLYAMITRMDAGVGKILDELERLGLQDNTVVLFTSDNGPWLHTVDGQSCMRYNGLFRGCKQDVLEGGIRVPAMIRWPEGLPVGRKMHSMVHFTDWLPTLLSAAGIEDEPFLPLDGKNILSVLRGENDEIVGKRFWQWNRYDPVPRCNAAMRDGDWKLYWPRVPEAMSKMEDDNEWYHRMMDEPHFEMDIDRTPVARELPAEGSPGLYNIADDPTEANDLSTEYPKRLENMNRELENWFDIVESERRNLRS